MHCPPTSRNCEIPRLGVADVYLLIFTFDWVYSPFAALVWGGQCIWVEMTAVFGDGAICRAENQWASFRNESAAVVFIDMWSYIHIVAGYFVGKPFLWLRLRKCGINALRDNCCLMSRSAFSANDMKTLIKPSLLWPHQLQAEHICLIS